MKKLFILFFVALFFIFSCETKKKEVVKVEVKEALVMYEPSEMTVLMREMFEFQETSKKQIEDGALPKSFPEKFKKIHTAELSDQFEHDESFQNFTNLYFMNIENLERSTKEDAKKNFNSTINSCIACHQTTCMGPITRIKKLLIK